VIANSHTIVDPRTCFEFWNIFLEFDFVLEFDFGTAGKQASRQAGSSSSSSWIEKATRK